tara:strand:+ start:164 stop:637 length:474 start_codon:yes stop_codon:yes gene_type:complete
MIDEIGKMFGLKKGITNYLVNTIKPNLSDLFKKARGDNLTTKQELALLSSTSPTEKYLKSLKKNTATDDFEKLLGDFSAPTGFVSRTRQAPKVQLDSGQFIVNQRLQSKLGGLLAKSTFQDPNVGKLLTGVGINIPVARPNITTGASTPSRALKQIG